jgi:hypothetical protein
LLSDSSACRDAVTHDSPDELLPRCRLVLDILCCHKLHEICWLAVFLELVHDLIQRAGVGLWFSVSAIKAKLRLHLCVVVIHLFEDGVLRRLFLYQERRLGLHWLEGLLVLGKLLVEASMHVLLVDSDCLKCSLGLLLSRSSFMMAAYVNVPDAGEPDVLVFVL